MHTEIADLLFPDVPSLAEVMKDFPPRQLPAGAVVTRFAPSPTGFIHIGSIYIAQIGALLAKQSGGLFLLRIEDTDQQRKIERGVEEIVEAMEGFGIFFDEGPYIENGALHENGAYGPYIQSRRTAIYKACIRELIAAGKAYPSFQTPEEIEAIRNRQKEQNVQIGYYGAWAADRTLTLDQIKERLGEGQPYVIRLRADVAEGSKVRINDAIKGELEIAANDIDHVLIKKDGHPTYHFAVVVDDTLMNVNLVLRGDEWLGTLPLHVQLYEAFGFPLPQFAHISPIGKIDGNSKRKLSKRKDPESAVSYYLQQGYPIRAIKAYLLNIANSAFEEWFLQHPTADFSQFTLDLDRMSPSISLFDLQKLQSVSKEVIASYTVAEIFELVAEWAQAYSPELDGFMQSDPDYVKRILNIGRDHVPPRKDLINWSGVLEVYGFFFDDYFQESIKSRPPQLPKLPPEVLVSILRFFKEDHLFTITDKEAWFGEIKDFAAANGFALRKKDYKDAPEKYKGLLEDVMGTIRMALTNSTSSPDLFEVIHIMGRARVERRIDAAKQHVIG